ncbi:MAG: deoxynucleoside kinase [Oscillospiraceae bacterium]|nr:deoxynucleoside kinase [Oscillospiraceae bacterium]
MSTPGNLIVFEGIDGSGKSTQFELLCKLLEAKGQDFRRLSFPRYSEESSALIRMYLGGEFGSDPDAVGAYAASIFFTVDRIASYIQEWKSYYQSGGLILTDRYTTSNAIHQGAKLPADEREAYFKWLYEFEFNLVELPRPSCVIYMDIEASQSIKRLERRQAETGTSADIHETDFSYLEQSAHCGRQAADFYGWHKIACFDESRERTVEDIHSELASLIFTTLKHG